jgi:hypothetical protein
LLSCIHPRIRAKGETPLIFKRELDIVGRRLIELGLWLNMLPLLVLKIGLRCFQRTSMGGRSRLGAVSLTAPIYRNGPCVTQQLDFKCLEWLNEAGKEKERYSAANSLPRPNILESVKCNSRDSVRHWLSALSYPLRHGAGRTNSP